RYCPFVARASCVCSCGRPAAVATLDAVAARIDDWPLAGCAWKTVAAWMEEAYRRGRHTFAAADDDPTVERLHDWRKRVKDIWYHQRLTCPAWPEVIGAQSEEAHRLSEILGDDHDLAVLAELLGADVGSRPTVPIDPEPLLGLIAERRAELVAGARHLGTLIYAERGTAFGQRVRRYLEHARARCEAEAADGVRV
ncbi:MAG: CHAD domain-containing protein, partial [Solirubrobacteraceae bacterium]